MEFHTCDFFPERWFQLVCLLRCTNDFLYARLEARKYAEVKIKENIECEIFGTVSDWIYQNYNKDIILDLKSETVKD